MAVGVNRPAPLSFDNTRTGHVSSAVCDNGMPSVNPRYLAKFRHASIVMPGTTRHIAARLYGISGDCGLGAPGDGDAAEASAVPPSVIVTVVYCSWKFTRA